MHAPNSMDYSQGYHQNDSAILERRLLQYMTTLLECYSRIY